MILPYANGNICLISFQAAYAASKGSLKTTLPSITQ